MNKCPRSYNLSLGRNLANMKGCCSCRKKVENKKAQHRRKVANNSEESKTGRKMVANTMAQVNKRVVSMRGLLRRNFGKMEGCTRAWRNFDKTEDYKRARMPVGRSMLVGCKIVHTPEGCRIVGNFGRMLAEGCRPVGRSMPEDCMTAGRMDKQEGCSFVGKTGRMIGTRGCNFAGRIVRSMEADCRIARIEDIRSGHLHHHHPYLVLERLHGSIQIESEWRQSSSHDFVRP